MVVPFQILIVTVTSPDNGFPENFSCWCAGALEAKGVLTVLEVLELFKEPMSSKFLKIQHEKHKRLQQLLAISEMLLLILPLYNNMLPDGLDPFIRLLASKKHCKGCKLITIGMDVVSSSEEIQCHLDFNYPLDQLYKRFGSTLCTVPTQIQNSPSGDMCQLFSESYDDLCLIIQHILYTGSQEFVTDM